MLFSYSQTAAASLHADQFAGKNLFHIPVVLLIFLWIQMKQVKAPKENTEIFPFHPPPHIHRERGLNKQYWIRIGCLILWVMMGICFLMTVGRRTQAWHLEGNYRHSVFLLHTMIKITVQISAQWKPGIIILHLGLKSQFLKYKVLSNNVLHKSLGSQSGTGTIHGFILWVKLNICIIR